MAHPAAAPAMSEIRAWVRDRMARDGWMDATADAARTWGAAGYPAIGAAIYAEVRAAIVENA